MLLRSSLLHILGDPGAVSGAGDKVKTGGKKFDEQKVQTKNRSPWGQTLYGPVPNGRANTRSWLGRKPFVFFCPIGGQQRLKTIWCVLTRRITTRLPLLAMFAWLVRRQFNSRGKFPSWKAICQRYRSPWLKERRRKIRWTSWKVL